MTTLDLLHATREFYQEYPKGTLCQLMVFLEIAYDPGRTGYAINMSTRGLSENKISQSIHKMNDRSSPVIHQLEKSYGKGYELSLTIEGSSLLNRMLRKEVIHNE